jgi:hypothetical protein
MWKCVTVKCASMIWVSGALFVYLRLLSCCAQGSQGGHQCGARFSCIARHALCNEPEEVSVYC